MVKDKFSYIINTSLIDEDRFLPFTKFVTENYIENIDYILRYPKIVADADLDLRFFYSTDIFFKDSEICLYLKLKFNI